MSGAWRRLSWFISSSYSKSEIARSPLTIAIAPRSRANSTSSVLKGCTTILPNSCVACSKNPIRSSVENIVLPFRQGKFTTQTTTWSYIDEARLITSRWPYVTGSNVPGHTAMRLSGGFMGGVANCSGQRGKRLPDRAKVDADQRVAVAALVQASQLLELQRSPPVALGHDSRVR